MPCLSRYENGGSQFGPACTHTDQRHRVEVAQGTALGQVWIRIHCVETADDGFATRIILRQILKHPVRNIRIGKRLADASELPEILLDWASEVRVIVQELLGVMHSRPKVLHLESAEDGVPHHLEHHAVEYVCEILVTERTLDDTCSHVVLDPPVVIGGPPRSDSNNMSLNHSGNKLISSREIGQRVRREVTHPSLNILSNLLSLQVCHDLLLPFEKVVFGKPRKAIQSIRRGGRHRSEVRELRSSGDETGQPMKEVKENRPRQG